MQLLTTSACSVSALNKHRWDGDQQPPASPAPSAQDRPVGERPINDDNMLPECCHRNLIGSINTTKGNYPPTQLNKLPLNSGGRKWQAAFAIADLAPGKRYLERTLDQHNPSLTIIACSSWHSTYWLGFGFGTLLDWQAQYMGCVLIYYGFVDLFRVCYSNELPFLFVDYRDSKTKENLWERLALLGTCPPRIPMKEDNLLVQRFTVLIEQQDRQKKTLSRKTIGKW